MIPQVADTFAPKMFPLEREAVLNTVAQEASGNYFGGSGTFIKNPVEDFSLTGYATKIWNQA